MQRKFFPNICASDDGRWIAGGFIAGGLNNPPNDSVTLWEAGSGRLLFAKPIGGRLTAVELDTATRTLAAECLTDQLQQFVALFDMGTGKRRGTVTPRSDTGAGVYPSFTRDGRLLINTERQLEWSDPLTGRFLSERVAPQSCRGFLVSTQSCGRFRLIEYTNTDPKFGVDRSETHFGIEVLSEKDGVLQGVLLKKHPNVLAYSTYPQKEIAALMLGNSNGCPVRVFDVATRRLLAERTFPETGEEGALNFSPDGSLLYVGRFPVRAWDWRNNSVRSTRPHEVQDFSTFFLGKREVYSQDSDGTIHDVRSNALVVRLRS